MKKPLSGLSFALEVVARGVVSIRESTRYFVAVKSQRHYG